MTGRVGEKGEPGRAGEPGLTGPKGRPVRGFVGVQFTDNLCQGPVGLAGPKGRRGPEGAPGVAGPAGEKGVAGGEGVKGERGPAGPPGLPCGALMNDQPWRGGGGVSRGDWLAMYQDILSINTRLELIQSAQSTTL